MRRTLHTDIATHNPRAGTVLLFAMVALLLVSVIGAGLVKTALMQRRQARREQNRAQSQWLAESGAARAAAMLAGNPGYKGETWNVSAKELGGRKPGRVVIAVAAVSGQPRRRRVTVVADFPWDGLPIRPAWPQRSRTTKSVDISLKQPTPPEKTP